MRAVGGSLVTSIALSACGLLDKPTGLDNQAQLFVHSRALSLLVGDTVSVGATRRSSEGAISGTRAAGFEREQQISEASLQWRVRDSAIVSVSAGGVLRAEREGSTYLILSDGRLRDSTTVSVRAADVFRSWTTLKMGTTHACAIDTDRALWCWGGSWSGELGTGERLRSAYYLTPQRVTLPEPIIDVAVGSQHTCALGSTGTVFCTGDNLEGQVPGTGNEKVLRFRTASIAVRLTSIDAAGGETCGITATGAVHCWGGLFFRTGTTFSATSGRRYSAVSVGVSHRCALTDLSELYCWGNLSGSNGTMPTSPR